MSDLRFVAVDIETTGFAPRDAVTVVGFRVEMGCRVFLQTDGREAAGMSDMVGEHVPEPVQCTTHASEHKLFEAVTAFAEKRFRNRDVLLVGYNAETYRGGFDLPFLRTRLATLNQSWLFDDVPYADLLPVITNRFNLMEDATDLGSAYDQLCGEVYKDVDPFGESNEAITAFEAGAFAELVHHNCADILRTYALGQTAKQYCSRSDFSLKSLTPAIAATRRDRPPPDDP